MNVSAVIIQILTSIVKNPWLLAKPLILAAYVIYITFAAIIVRQVKLMSQTLSGVLLLPLRFVSLVHLLLAIGIFLLVLVIL